jgi:hypothetical protein
VSESKSNKKWSFLIGWEKSNLALVQNSILGVSVSKSTNGAFWLAEKSKIFPRSWGSGPIYILGVSVSKSTNGAFWLAETFQIFPRSWGSGPIYILGVSVSKSTNGVFW